jgi:chemotaxis protein MotB
MANPEPIPNFRPRSGRSWPGWVVSILVAAAFAAFVWFRYLPEVRDNAGLAKQLEDAKAEAEQLQRKLKALAENVEQIRGERDKVNALHAQALKEKQEAVEALNRMKEELSSKLEVEVESGDIAITRRGNELVVDVADKILFDVGKTEIKERGAQILAQVAGVLAQFKDHVIQVGGHTDSARVVSPELRERYPSNWELSTARATNVVRFLQDKARLPGERLVAAGFAHFRPVASNKNEPGRQKNRRIEIALLPKSELRN